MEHKIIDQREYFYSEVLILSYRDFRLSVMVRTGTFGLSRWRRQEDVT